MKLFLVSRTDETSYDTYDALIVAAQNEQDARTIHPNKTVISHAANGKWMGVLLRGDRDGLEFSDEDKLEASPIDDFTWVEFSDIHKLSVKYIGETEIKRGVILASFNAG